MELYFGGAYQGKLDYVCGRKNIVKELCGNAEDTMSNIYSEDDKYIKNKICQFQNHHTQPNVSESYYRLRSFLQNGIRTSPECGLITQGKTYRAGG